MTRPFLPRAFGAMVLTLFGANASALPITVSNTGYWIDTVGTNTVGIAGGGAPGGVVTALFDTFTSPTAAQGTTASASFGSVATGAPTPQSGSAQWAKRVLNPSAAQLQPLTVVFRNGFDAASVTTRSLVGVNAVPLVQDLAIDAGASAFSPTVRWSLPTATLFDIDAVQLVFYNDATDLEIGNRVTLAPSATSFTFGSVLPAGLALTVDVRLYDLLNPATGLADSGNILASSRAYVNYTVPAVPEAATPALLAGGLGLLALVHGVRRRRFR